ncbi:SDR family NAD(P)-dependent oxidoreductase [Motilimonas sp. 1_MG-2023]|uniref:SDR family NAD(P)-dependent oxidoreductase n=1 Tax=Motilimonas sp. 1_MG-2023 TaxID=3062672 RepID=UPI0026E35AC3|nr:SDR family NAD(P)-dependent oxidoreductase [Motilimonas sp. 1_MG-2023]MDO6527018.1 SDR family NAD(P)-dependent oxidoreductase [Motilimonas sp. 1_MG-2023]
MLNFGVTKSEQFFAVYLRSVEVMFTGKKIVITGASPDLGQALAILFAQLGAELFLSARTLPKAETTAALVREVAPQAKVSCFQVDVTQQSEIKQFAQDVAAQAGKVDILINNASSWLTGNIIEASDADIAASLNSTALGSVLVTKHFLPLLERSTCPDIVFINSTASLPNDTHGTCNEAFSAAKAGQSTFADRLRHRLKGSGIRILVIYPADFDSPSPLVKEEWDECRGANHLGNMTARNVFNSLKFALSQDRICSVDSIVLSNNK